MFDSINHSKKMVAKQIIKKDFGPKTHLKIPSETYSQFLKRTNYCFKNAYMQDSDCYLNDF